jgi:hypothetical protein
MTALPTWCTDRVILRALGLKLQIVRRFGQTARWISCRACGEGVVALWCTYCGWELAGYTIAYNHLAGLRKLPRLYLLSCPKGCNRAAIENPPAEFLVAQAEAAAYGEDFRAAFEANRSRTPVR